VPAVGRDSRRVAALAFPSVSSRGASFGRVAPESQWPRVLDRVIVADTRFFGGSLVGIPGDAPEPADRVLGGD
jgi:hypothetical protein